ncbi:urease accessory protein UreF [Neorhizobium lilium]|uniref:Urease accessory protein UreF n=2 Tax=Neorhizobium lilium TaxID=2503024 RepID=A0A444LKB3_9HYPH|nr:urease accessory protein UreF [Neorhizobium lilium]
MAWLSPAFPIGGFAYSGGLERAVHDKLIADAAGLADWLGILLQHGSLWTDGVLLVEAWRSYTDQAALAEVAELGLALAGSAERYAETSSLGRGFVAAAAAWPSSVFEILPKDLPFPVAVGAVSAAHGVGVEQALAAYLHAATSQAVSAAIRLNVCGQRQGLGVLAGSEPAIEAFAAGAPLLTLDDLGSAAVQADIASLRHETQHSRLFRS